MAGGRAARCAIWPGARRPLRVRLLDHPLAVAYCLPGVRPRIVLSRGVIDVLAPDQLATAVTHERAHERGRHDLVIQPFRAWQQAFPFLPAAGRALAAQPGDHPRHRHQPVPDSTWLDRSAGGGKTWQQVKITGAGNWSCLAYASSLEGWVLQGYVFGSKLLRTADAGRTWRQVRF